MCWLCVIVCVCILVKVLWRYTGIFIALWLESWHTERHKTEGENSIFLPPKLVLVLLLWRWSKMPHTFSRFLSHTHTQTTSPSQAYTDLSLSIKSTSRTDGWVGKKNQHHESLAKTVLVPRNLQPLLALLLLLLLIIIIISNEITTNMTAFPQGFILKAFFTFSKMHIWKIFSSFKGNTVQPT